MRNDGYDDHIATTGEEYFGEVEFVRSGVHGESNYWEWSISCLSYNLETEEEECGGVDNGWAYTESEAWAAMEASLSKFKRGD